VARTDLWPELAAACHGARVPVVLFSATQGPLRWHQNLLKRIFRWRLEAADYIFTVSPADKLEIEKLNPHRPVEVLGDTRYDQVLHRLANPKEIKLPPRDQRSAGTPPVLICGSTWPADEHVLTKAAAPLVKAGRLSLILVPHEPTPAHLAKIATRMKDAGLNHVLYNELNRWDQGTVLIIDKTGILAELYTRADIAFVGGSFSRQVHSVMEPLAAGLVTIVGPRHRNNREAVEFQNEELGDGLTMVNSCADSAAVERVLATFLGSHNRAEWRARIKGAVTSRTGASSKVAARLEEITL
jgi:3-deoxy-D-manno-octulosonic-acid transferase